MANLMEILKSSQSAQQASPQLGETEQISKLVGAKSGKAAPVGSGPRQSSLASAVANNVSRGQIQEQQQQAGLVQEQQVTQLNDINQRGQQQQTEFSEKNKQLKNQFDTRMGQMLDNYAMEGRKLDTTRDIENMEQVGFNIRLNNDQYVNKLKQEGQKARLDNDISFKTQLMMNAFADTETVLKDNIMFKTIMDADSREFEKQLSAIDANIAMGLMRKEMEAQQAGDMWAGLGGVAKAGLTYAENKPEDKSDLYDFG